MGRREFMRLAALATTTVLPGCGADTPQQGSAPPLSATPAATASGTSGGGGMGAGAAAVVPERFASFITPNEHFYITVYSSVEPAIDLANWSLSIRGLDGREKRLSYANLVKHPAALDRMVTLECVGNGVGGSLISNAIWRGVPLAALLNDFGIEGQPYKVVFRAADNYHTAVPLEVAMDGYSMLAWQMNGVDLPRNHGYPVRVIIPGKYGMKSPKWLTSIELVDSDYLGYWESRGWDDVATIVPFSRFTNPLRFTEVQPGRIPVEGLAFAGAQPIAAVEISEDRRQSWHPAQITTDPAPFVWSFWRYEWDLSVVSRRSSAQLALRCSDAAGRRQREKAPPQLPDGLQTQDAGYDTLELIVQS